MDFETLTKTFPEIGITFTEDALVNALKTKDLHCFNHELRLVPKGSEKQISLCNVITIKSHVVQYDVVYLKWGKLVTENWTEDTFKGHVPYFSLLQFGSGYLVFYVKSNGDTFKFDLWDDAEIMNKSELLEFELKYEMVAVKKLVKCVFQYS